MRAIVYRDFGSADVLKTEEVDKPTPGDTEVLVAVHAAAVNFLDWAMVRGKPAFIRLVLGVRKPKRLGIDMAGRVEAVGRSVTRFKPGDEVFGSARGAFAEYVCTPESALSIKPPNVTFEQAAGVVVAGVTALQGIRDHGSVQRGQKVLINGASGGIGTFAVQIAKSLGADVTGVCSTRNVDLVRSLGADQVIDYTRDDFTMGAKRYDVVFDMVGNHSSSACRRVLTRNGRYIVAGGPPFRGIGLWALSRLTKPRQIAYLARPTPTDLGVLGELMSSGRVTPVVDRTYRLEETSEAIRHVAAGHSRGKVVIAVSSAT